TPYASVTGKVPLGSVEKLGREFEREFRDVNYLVVLEHPEDRLISSRLRREVGDRRPVAGVERALEEGEGSRCVQIVEVDRHGFAGTEVFVGGGEFVGSVFEFSVFHVDGHVCHTGRSHRAGINRGKLAGFDNGGATIPIWPNPSVAGSITRR